MPGHSYKGSAVRPYRTTADVGPILTETGIGDALWVWSLPNPPFWHEQSFDGTDWVDVNTVTGTTRTTSGDFSSGDIASVIGVDAAGNQITGRSNTVVWS